MATIKVEKNHSLGLEEAKKRAKELLAKFQRKLEHMISDVSWSADGTKGTAKGKMFTAEFIVTEKTFTCTIELGLMASMMKGQIESQVRDNVEKTFV